MQACMAAVSIFLVNAEGVQHIFHALYQFAMKPESIYGKTARRMFLTAFPMALIASVPARVLYDASLSPLLILWQIGAAGIFITISVRIFNWSLKYYTGASS